MGGWNGAGTFSKTYSWVADQLNGIKIRADRHDANDTDFTNGINNCLTKDGQNAATANLPMATYKHTNVGKATALNQYATAEQVIDNELKYYVATGTDTYAITPSPAITAYAAGQSFFVNFTNGNTGAATININSLGAKALTKNVSTALVSGDISAGKIYEIVYDGTQFQVKDNAGDVIGQASSVDSEIALFSGTGGKTIKRATGTGFVKVVSGVIQTPVSTISSSELSTTVQNAILDDFVAGVIERPSNGDYRLLVNVPYGFTISSITTRSESGTCTATFKINTTALGGTANSVSSTEQTQTHSSANALVSGDDLVVTISSNSSCVKMSFLVKFARGF